MEKYKGVPEGLREAYDQAFSILEETFLSGGKLLICGNGGSCADAEHIEAELMKGFRLMRPVGNALFPDGAPDEALQKLQGALPAVALSGSSPLVSAVINDTDADLLFAQQVLGLGKEGDVLLCISTSGNARDCCLAAMVARQKKMTVIALTGQTGGKLAGLADCLLNVPEKETYKVQELHLPLYHALCARLEESFFGGERI
ncbi:MAG: SIS domain-containing protein [Firmicutes bacterium]|nr:SIS domain-containing protein [Bacillota bacterium]